MARTKIIRHKTIPKFLDSWDAAVAWANKDDIDVEDEGTLDNIANYTYFAQRAYDVGEIIVHRAVKLPRKPDGSYALDTQCLGKSWSFEQEGAQVLLPSVMSRKGGDDLVITGRVDPADVDWEFGFYSYLIYGADQSEVSMHPHSPVTIDSVVVKGTFDMRTLATTPERVLLDTPAVGDTGPASESWDDECGPAAKRKAKRPRKKNPLPDDGDYQMDHRPADTESGAPLYDVTANGIYPADFYDRPDWYPAGHDSDWEAVGKIRRYRGKPNGWLRIYRAVPKGVREIRPGDWVAITKGYARDHGRHASDPSQDMVVLRGRVAARDIVTSGDSYQEWGYVGAKILTTQMKLMGTPGYAYASVVFRPRARAKNPLTLSATRGRAATTKRRALLPDHVDSRATLVALVNEAAARLNVEIENKILGCGSNGCVVPVKGRPLVLKLSSSSDERKMLEAVRETRAYEGFARIVNGPLSLRSNPLFFAYVREALAPYWKTGAPSTWPDYINQASDAAGDGWAEGFLAALGRFEPPYLEIAMTMRRVYEEAGVLIFDANPQNMGWRADGTLVLYDGEAADWYPGAGDPPPWRE